MSTQAIWWERGRPRPQRRRQARSLLESIFALRAHGGRDARGPSKSLNAFSRY